MSFAWRQPATYSKSSTLEGSLRCFTLGIASLVPVLGFPLALLGLLEFRGVVLRKDASWNAARPYLMAGAILSGVGLTLNLLVLGFLSFCLLRILWE